jgi:sulfur carrier protein
MIIYINDHPLTLETMCTLEEMLITNEIFAEYMAVAINNQFISKPNYARTFLNEGDRVDLIMPTEGG